MALAIPCEPYLKPMTSFQKSLQAKFSLDTLPETFGANRQCRVKKTIKGKASFYGKNDGFAGKKTASGKIFNPLALTAAHKTLPFGTRVKVTNIKNGRSVIVTITDRGPFIPGRELDVSYRAAQNLKFENAGVAKISMQICG